MRLNQFGNSKKGISAIELLITVSIIAVALTALLGLVNLALRNSNLIKQEVQANAILCQTVEAVRNFRDQTSWDVDGLGTLTVEQAYHPEQIAGSPADWLLVAGEETLGIFSQKVVLGTVFRDTDDNIASSGFVDVNTKIATATVSWQEKGKQHQVEIVTYFTNWQQQ